MRKEWTNLALLAALAFAAGLAARKFRRASGMPRPRTDWPVNFAHRGASIQAPENTLEAFRLAVEEGAPGLELDVHLSRDGVVVLHDDTVDRTTDGTGFVGEKTTAEVCSLDAGYRFSCDGGRTFPYRGRGLGVPVLGEVYRRFPGASVNVEIKEGQPGVEEAVLRTIKEVHAEDRTLAASQKHRVIKRFRRVSGGKISTSASRFEIEVFYLLSRLRLEFLLRPDYDALQVPIRYRGVEVPGSRFLEAAHGRGVRVDVWTVDDPAEMRRLLDLGVDVIMTNRPRVLAEVLGQRAGFRQDPPPEE